MAYCASCASAHHVQLGAAHFEAHSGTSASHAHYQGAPESPLPLGPMFTRQHRSARFSLGDVEGTVH